MVAAIESASVIAGQWIYLFFNNSSDKFIEFWKVSEKSRNPERWTIEVNGSTELSEGGPITAVILPNNSIHLFFIGLSQDHSNVKLLREIMLEKADQAGTPGKWINQALEKKDFDVDAKSMLCAAVDSTGKPRVFYNKADDTQHVYFAHWVVSDGDGDWEGTKFTGVTHVG